MSTTAERVAKLREARKALGLKRLEVYVHPDDVALVHIYIAALSQRRLKHWPSRECPCAVCAAAVHLKAN